MVHFKFFFIFWSTKEIKAGKWCINWCTNKGKTGRFMTQNVCLQNIYITIVPFLSCIVCIFIRLLQHSSQQKRVSHIAIIVGKHQNCNVSPVFDQGKATHKIVGCIYILLTQLKNCHLQTAILKETQYAQLIQLNKYQLNKPFLHWNHLKQSFQS